MIYTVIHEKNETKFIYKGFSDYEQEITLEFCFSREYIENLSFVTLLKFVEEEALRKYKKMQGEKNEKL